MCATETPPLTGRPADDDLPRDDYVVAAYSAPSNPSMAEVGAQFGISGERVRQLIAGWETRTGQRVVRSVSRRKQARLAEIERNREPPPCLEQLLLAGAVLNATTGCWEWVGKTHRVRDSVYPVVRFGGKEEFANRVAYELWCGELRPSDIVLVTCGELCINPAHLHALSRSENMRTRVRIAVPREPQTHCKQGHPLTPDNVLWNPGWRVRNGERVRVRTRLCKICNGVRQARSSGTPKPPPLPDDPLERVPQAVSTTSGTTCGAKPDPSSSAMTRRWSERIPSRSRE